MRTKTTHNMALPWLHILLLLGLCCVDYIKAICTYEQITGKIANGGATLSSATSVTACFQACQYDPTCMAFSYTSTCSLHTGKTAYKLVDSNSPGFDHYFMKECDYWNYAGLVEGCGSTYFADKMGDTGTTVPATSRSNCWYNCLEHPRCIGWDWTPGPDTCSLLSDQGLQTLTDAVGTEHHTIICPGEPYDSLETGWSYYPMYYVKGGVRQTGSFTLVECQDACYNDNDCLAIDWDIDWETCYMHMVKKNGKLTHCVNELTWSKNAYHMKKTACGGDFPPPFITT